MSEESRHTMVIIHPSPATAEAYLRMGIENHKLAEDVRRLQDRIRTLDAAVKQLEREETLRVKREGEIRRAARVALAPGGSRVHFELVCRMVLGTEPLEPEPVTWAVLHRKAR